MFEWVTPEEVVGVLGEVREGFIEDLLPPLFRE
jgi:hypothetical protein